MSGMDSALGLVDAAVTTPTTTPDSGTSTADVQTVDTGTEQTLDSTVESQNTDGAESTESTDSELNPDGSEKTPEQKAAAAEAGKGKAAADPTPQSIRTALKQLRDANPDDPATQAAVKTLHGSYERWQAAKAIFPNGVAEMKEYKQALSSIGGMEGLASRLETLEQVSNSDQLLAAGDPQLIENIVEDLKASNKLDALGKITPHLLDACLKNDPEGYYKTMTGHIVSNLKSAGFVNTVNALGEALESGDTAKAMKIVRGMGKWYTDMRSAGEPKKDELTPEKEAFMKEKADFETSKVTEFRTSVASAAEKQNNTTLGAELRPFLKTPFFKAFTRENLYALGNKIKADFYADLKGDTNYQTMMKSMWGAKNPDRDKILEYHKAALESRARRIVQAAVYNMYPNSRSKSTSSSAGRAANAAATANKSAAPTTGPNAKLPTPIYVAAKPKDLLRGEPQAELLEIAGKGWVKNAKGGKTLVTWRR